MNTEFGDEQYNFNGFLLKKNWCFLSDQEMGVHMGDWLPKTAVVVVCS